MNSWISGSVVITHDIGLHARPSIKLTKLAKSYPGTIQVAGEPQGPWIDAKSIVKVMAMKIERNATLHVRAAGSEAGAAVAAVIDLVQRDFGEAASHATGD